MTKFHHRRRSDFLVTCSRLAIAAAASLCVLNARAAQQFTGDAFPNGFTVAQDVIEPDDGIVFLDTTIDQFFLNNPGVTIQGGTGTGVSFQGISSLSGLFDNRGNIQGPEFGVYFGPSASVTGGFSNSGEIVNIDPVDEGEGGEGPLEQSVGPQANGLIDLGPGSFTPGASVITFSERPFGAINPVYNFPAVPEIGDVTVSFGGHFSGQSVKTVGIVATLDGITPLGPLSLEPTAPNTFITNDGSNPSSPVLSGTPLFNGPISVLFSQSVAAVGLAAGFFDGINSTSIEAFDRDGNSLGTITNSALGIEFYGLAVSDGQPRIAGISFYVTGNEPAGFAIDNVTFGGAGVVVELSSGIGVYSEVQDWAGGFTNEAAGVIRGFRHGVQMQGNSFSGNFENLHVIEGLSGTGVDLEFFTFDGDFIVGEGARIAGGQTGARLALRTWHGDALVNGEIEGNAENTGLHILTKDLLGGITISETGALTALSNALKLEVGTVRDPVKIQGRVEATGENGVAIAILPYTDLGDGGEGGEGGGGDGGEGGEGFFDYGFGVSGAELLPLGLDMGLAGGLEITGEVLAPDTGTAIDVANYVGPAGITNNGGKIKAGTALIHSDGFGDLAFVQKGANAETAGNIVFGNLAGDFAEFQGGTYTGEIVGTGGNDFVFVNPNGTDVAFVSGSAAGLNVFEVTDEEEDGIGRSVIGSSAFDANGEGFDVFAQTIILKGKVFVDDQTDLVANDLMFDPDGETSLFLTTNTSQKPSFVSDGPLVLKGALRAVLDSSFQGTTQREFVYEDVFQSSDSIINELSTAFAAGSSGLFTVSVEIEDAGVIEDDSLALGQQSLRALLTGGQTGNLVVTRLSLANLPCGGNSNQNAVGQALEKVFTDGTPGFSSTFNTIAQLSDICGAVDIFDSYAGVPLAESPFSVVQVDDLLPELILMRLNPASNIDPANCQVVSVGRNCFTQYAQAGAVPGQVMSDGDPFAWLRTGNRRAGSTAVWGRAVGAFGERDPGPFSQGSEQQTAGLVAGADHVLDEAFLLGAALQWTDSEVDFNNSPDQAEVRTLQIGGYFSWGDARLYVNGMGSVIVREFETRRTLITGETPRAEFDSVAGQGQLELGAVYELDGARVQPTLTVNYSKQWVDGYSETGAGVLGLTVADNEIESLSSTLGIKVAATLREGGFTVTPEFRAQWRHEYLDTRQVITASFVGAPGAPFTVRSDTVGRDTAIMAAGLTMPAWENAVVYTDYEAALNEAYDSHTVSIGLRVSW